MLTKVVFHAKQFLHASDSRFLPSPPPFLVTAFSSVYRSVAWPKILVPGLQVFYHLDCISTAVLKAVSGKKIIKTLHAILILG